MGFRFIYDDDSFKQFKLLRRLNIDAKLNLPNKQLKNVF